MEVRVVVTTVVDADGVVTAMVSVTVVEVGLLVAVLVSVMLGVGILRQLQAVEIRLVSNELMIEGRTGLMLTAVENDLDVDVTECELVVVDDDLVVDDDFVVDEDFLLDDDFEEEVEEQGLSSIILRFAFSLAGGGLQVVMVVVLFQLLLDLI